jgi:hypothetical protein
VKSAAVFFCARSVFLLKSAGKNWTETAAADRIRLWRHNLVKLQANTTTRLNFFSRFFLSSPFYFWMTVAVGSAKGACPNFWVKIANPSRLLLLPPLLHIFFLKH